MLVFNNNHAVIVVFVLAVASISLLFSLFSILISEYIPLGTEIFIYVLLNHLLWNKWLLNTDLVHYFCVHKCRTKVVHTISRMELLE